MADWLDEEVPIEWLTDFLALIHATPNLDWLLLTKRPENWLKRVGESFHHIKAAGFPRWKDGPAWEDSLRWLAGWLDGEKLPANVWIGTTVEDQSRADERIPALLRIPARVRFLSCEPLLSGIDIAKWLSPDPCVDHYDAPLSECLHWVICGGESGPGARPMHPDWARSLRGQCEAAGVSFFMKQMGGTRDARGALDQIPEDLRVRQFPEANKLSEKVSL